MWQEELVDELKAVRPAERSKILEIYKDCTGLSLQQLYRVAKKHGFVTGRQARSDKGSLKIITTEQAEGIAALLHVTGRENKGPIMPVARAIHIFEQTGLIDPEKAKPSTVNRILRERQLSKRHQRAAKPHTSMRSLHPNHVHAFDASVCIQYYLKDKKGICMMDEREFYKNKPHNFGKIKERLLRYVLVDHFSGAYYFKYYSTTGETQDNLYDFLRESWGRKADPRLPFCGVPFLVLRDAGSANTSKAITALMERLGVNVPEGNPHNPRRQGIAEVTHNIIEPWFETSLRIEPATSVDQLNVWAMDFMIWHQATQEHTRHKMTRTECWLSIKEKELRELPDDDILQVLYANPEEDRTVDGEFYISYRGKSYNLKHVAGIYKGAKVKVVLEPYSWPNITVVYKDTRYDVHSIEPLPTNLGAFRSDSVIIGQQYKSQPETMTQQAVKRMENMAYGEERIREQRPFAGLKVMGTLSDEIDISFVVKRNTPMEIDREISDKDMSFVQFLSKLTQRVGAISKEQNRLLQETFGASIDKAKAEEVIRQMEEEGRLPSDAGHKDIEAANQ
jgi:hypothetical protein